MEKLDPVNAAIAIATLIFGPAMAAFIGPYSVIVIAATVGAAWSLRRYKKQCAAVEVVSYFALMVFTAILLTVAATNALASWLQIAEPG